MCVYFKTVKTGVRISICIQVPPFICWTKFINVTLVFKKQQIIRIVLTITIKTSHNRES